MPTRDPQERVKGFEEVALGYTEEMAKAESMRCLQCKKPFCMAGCPVEVPIPEFIGLVAKGDYAGAIARIKEKNSLPAVCGRVCPQESQCEKLCILGKKGQPIAIGRVERFIADWELANQPFHPIAPPSRGTKVAVVGAGPAGLTCAADLAKIGYQVTVFEALHTAGGVLSYGIPQFRLPKEIVKQEVDNISKLGVEFRYNMVVGRVYTLDELVEQGYKAMFLGTGAGLPYFMGIPGEHLNGVYSANEWLTRTNLMKAYKFPEYGTPIKPGKRVAVVGGGNVAMDAVRTALRLGAEEAFIIYRRSEKEMPARLEEVEHAHEEGVKFHFLTCPIEVKGNEQHRVSSMICTRFELGEPDASGRRRPVAIPGSEFEMPVDTVVIAIGQGPNPLIPQTTPDLQTNKHGNIVVTNEETGQTSRIGVFAGGDVVTGAATVILAMGAGKKAAKAIDEYLTEQASR